MSAVNEALIRDIVGEVLGRPGNTCPLQMPGRRMPSAQSLFQSCGENVWAIHLQCFNCRPRYWRKSDKRHSVPAEVFSPVVPSRVEQRSFQTGRRIDGSLPCALAQGTSDTRQSQILQSGRTAGRARNNVVDVEGGFLGKLRQQTVLAATVRPLNHCLSERLRDGHVVTRLVSSAARLEVGATRSSRSIRRVPPLRGAHRQSVAFRRPACREVPATGGSPLLGDETAQGREAVLLRIAWFLAYARFPTPKQNARFQFQTQVKV